MFYGAFVLNCRPKLYVLKDTCQCQPEYHVTLCKYGCDNQWPLKRLVMCRTHAAVLTVI